jgi:hypothetical protein
MLRQAWKILEGIRMLFLDGGDTDAAARLNDALIRIEAERNAIDRRLKAEEDGGDASAAQSPPPSFCSIRKGKFMFSLTKLQSASATLYHTQTQVERVRDLLADDEGIAARLSNIALLIERERKVIDREIEAFAGN